MSQYQITITKKGLTESQVDKIVTGIVQTLKNVECSHKKITVPSTRADRYAAAQALADEARTEIESLKEELETWRDSLPENLQNSSKADDLGTAIDQLETAMNSLDEVADNSVDFPGMY